MTSVEYQKIFLQGPLAGMTVVERITTDCPEEFWPGKLCEDCITGNLWRMGDVLIDNVSVEDDWSVKI